MTYDPNRHHRRSIRLKGHDYTRLGAYYVTIVCQDRACLFGQIVDGVKQFGWPPYNGRFWQRSYYERIIRDEPTLNRVRAYIAANPANWTADHEHPDQEKTAHAQ